MKKERQILSYFGKYNDKYMYQFGDYISNSYSIIKYDSELERSDKLKDFLINFWNNFTDNFEFVYEVNDINIKDIKLSDKESYYKIDSSKLLNKNKNCSEFTINLVLLKKIYNIIKFDTINIIDNYAGYNPIIQLKNKNEVVSYVLPCRTY